MAFYDLSKFEYIVLDTETTGLKWWKDKIFGFAILLPGVNSFYYDVREEPRRLEWLRDEMPRVKLVVNHNIKYDLHFLREAGVQLPPDRLVCTMIDAALIDEHLLTYDLDSLGHKYCGRGKDTSVYAKLAELFGGQPTKHAQAPNLMRAPVSIVSRYACQDVETAEALYLWQRAEIENQELQKVCATERRLLPVIAEMEHGGVRIDVDGAERAVGDIDRFAVKAQIELDSMAGFPINPNPSASIHKLFAPKWEPQPDAPPPGPKEKAKGRWVLNDGTVVPSTDAGKASIDADVLRRMKHPAATKILQLRKLIKTRDTFLKGHLLGHHQNGVIHANYNQTKSDNDLGTGTGRFSVNDPALQQIHKRDVDIASIVRSLFLPDDGCDWDCHDWEQMDFRMFAHYTKMPQILAMYDKDPHADFHQIVADLTGINRKPRFAGDANAKQINLGMVFGMGPGKLAMEMGLPHSVRWDDRRKREWIEPGPEVEGVLARYHAAVPGVREFLRSASNIAKERGHVRTILGRRIRFPGGQFTHKAGGLVFQGSAADALKVKIVEVHEYFKTLNGDARLMLNVHDEFDSSVVRGRPDISAGIGRVVEKFDGDGTPIRFRVPIRSSAGIGPNWWVACKE